VRESEVQIFNFVQRTRSLECHGAVRSCLIAMTRHGSVEEQRMRRDFGVPR
jgi:hypothetical protein